MNANKKLMLAVITEIMLVFCLLRFGLVFTSGFGIFKLTYVVFAGVGILFLRMLLDKVYAGSLLRINAVFLLLNIVCVIFAQLVTTNATYAATAENYLNQLIVLFMLWGFYLYLRDMSKHRRRKVILIYLSAVVVSAVYTFYVEVNGHERIIRDTASGIYDPKFPLVYGGFDFIYGLVIIYAILFTVLISKKKQLTIGAKVLLLVMLMISALTIIASGYTTAFALILIYSLLNLSNKRTIRWMWICVMFLGFYVFPKQLVELIKALPYMPAITSSRMSDLILSFTGQGSVAYMSQEGQRFDRIMWSLNAFLAHPVRGVIASSALDDLGYHTEWIDQLARYGLPAAICSALFWMSTYRKMERSSRQSAISNLCVKNVFVLYVILGFVNPISMVVTTAPMFILAPFAEELFDTEEEDNYACQ